MTHPTEDEPQKGLAEFLAENELPATSVCGYYVTKAWQAQSDRIKVLEDALLKIANANRGYDEATYTNAYDALNQGKVTR